MEGNLTISTLKSNVHISWIVLLVKHPFLQKTPANDTLLCSIENLPQIFVCLHRLASKRHVETMLNEQKRKMEGALPISNRKVDVHIS